MSKKNQEEEINIPPRPPCPSCDMAIVMGLLTGSCQALDNKHKQDECWKKVIEPLEKQKKDPVDALTEHLLEVGEDKFDEEIQRANDIIHEAITKAKMIKEKQNKK